MQMNTSHRTLTLAFPQRIRWIARCWMVGSAALIVAGCVSQQTYDTARHEAKSRDHELAQTQADIQSLEQQRDETHAANQRDERALANLKSEMKKIQVSYDQVHKTNQAKLAALQHSIATLRARHQAMLKEISETKRNEKRLEAIAAQREKTMATTPSGPEALVMPVEGNPQESRMIAVIIPQSAPGDILAAPATPAPAHAPVTPAAGMTPAPATPQPAPVVAASSPPSVPTKTVLAPATPPAPQNDSWFSGVTGWLTALFDWLWV